MAKRNWKVAGLWVLGAICLLFGSIIAGGLGAGNFNDAGASLALLIAFVLFLLGGLLWISVSVATKTLAEI